MLPPSHPHVCLEIGVFVVAVNEHGNGGQMHALSSSVSSLASWVLSPHDFHRLWDCPQQRRTHCLAMPQRHSATVTAACLHMEQPPHTLFLHIILRRIGTDRASRGSVYCKGTAHSGSTATWNRPPNAQCGRPRAVHCLNRRHHLVDPLSRPVALNASQSCSPANSPSAFEARLPTAWLELKEGLATWQSAGRECQ